MKCFQIEQISVSKLLDEYSEFRDAEAFSRTAIDDPNSPLFDAILPTVQIFSHGEGWPFLHCGTRSTTAEIIGEDAAKNLMGQVGLGPRDFHAAVTPTYHEVVNTGIPIAQRVKGKLSIDGVNRLVSYYRYVFPLRIQSYEALGCMTRLSTRAQPF